MMLRLFLLLAFLPALAQASPDGPFLKIDTGHHVGNVFSISVTHNLAATGSRDKTIRLWRLPSGELARTLHVPIQPGGEGQIYAVALSPDGKRVAASGDTGATWSPGHALYLFDTQNGQLLGGIDAIEGMIQNLDYSPDGKHLAAVAAGKANLLVWDLEAGAALLVETYADRGSALDFSVHGQLATVSHDGQLRLYDHLKLSRKTALPGKTPMTVAFSPQGDRIAVGYVDRAEVDLFSTRDLKLLATTRAKSDNNGNFGAVAWSADGRYLVGGGTARDENRETFLRIWDPDGKLDPVDVPVGRNSINQIVPVRGGLVAYATADPSWGAFDLSTLRPVIENRVEAADFRDLGKGVFSVSADGNQVDFGTVQGGGRPYRLDLTRQTLTALTQGQRTGDKPPPGLLDRPDPQWRGQPLPWGKGELPRSFAETPDHKRFFLGSNAAIHLYDAAGKELARLDQPDEVWGLRLSGQGQRLVAALGDGSLRWFDLEQATPTELGGFFLRGKEWLLWSSEGFFTHSERGGESLAGFQMNRGALSTPDWIGFDQLYQVYYNPELVRKAFQGGHREEIARRAQAIGDVPTRMRDKPTPDLALVGYCLEGEKGCVSFSREERPLTRRIAPVAKKEGQTVLYRGQLPPGQKSVLLQYQAIPRAGGIGAIDLYQNDAIVGSDPVTRGQPLPKSAGKSDGGVRFTRKVHLEEGENRFFVRAFESSGGAYAQSPLVAFETTAAPEDTPTVAEGPPRLFVLAVGIDKYHKIPLRYAAKDASDFARVLKERKSERYGEVKVIELLDREATPANLDRAFAQLAKEVVPNRDAVAIYLAGHGVIVQEKYYFITANFDWQKEEEFEEKVAAMTYSQDRIKAGIAGLNHPRHLFLLLDTCHSGTMDVRKHGIEGANAKLDSMKHQLSDSSRFLVLAASSKEEEALDSYEVDGKPSQNGLFAALVLEALREKGRPNWAEETDALNVGYYVRHRLPKVAQQNKHAQSARFQQISQGEEEVFPLTRVEGP